MVVIFHIYAIASCHRKVETLYYECRIILFLVGFAYDAAAQSRPWPPHS